MDARNISLLCPRARACACVRARMHTRMCVSAFVRNAPFTVANVKLFFKFGCVYLLSHPTVCCKHA